MEKGIKFVSVIEDTSYLLWQQEIQCCHFNENFPSLNLEVVVLYENSEPSLWAQHLSKNNNVHFYKIDTFIKQLAQKYKGFYHSYGYYLYVSENGCQPFCGIDSDVILNKTLNFKKIRESNSCHFSDCSSYLSYEYLSQYLSEEQIEDLCFIVGIKPEVVKKMKKVGGAQMVFKNFNADIFEKIAYDGQRIQNYLVPLVKSGNKIQKHVAEMWSFAWNFALISDICVDEELSFCWATDDVSRMNETTFTHFAGFGEEGSFSKVIYTEKNPIFEDLSYVTVKDNCAYYWVQLMERYKHLCYKNK